MGHQGRGWGIKVGGGPSRQVQTVCGGDTLTKLVGLIPLLALLVKQLPTH